MPSGHFSSPWQDCEQQHFCFQPENAFSDFFVNLILEVKSISSKLRCDPRLGVTYKVLFFICEDVPAPCTPGAAVADGFCPKQGLG
jgi:hypothetical protein